MTAWLPWITTECIVVDCQFFSGSNVPQGVEVIVLVAPGIRLFGLIQKPCRSEPVERCWASVTVSFDYCESLVKRSQSPSLRQRRFGRSSIQFEGEGAGRRRSGTLSRSAHRNRAQMAETWRHSCTGQAGKRRQSDALVFPRFHRSVSNHRRNRSGHGCKGLRGLDLQSTRTPWLVPNDRSVSIQFRNGVVSSVQRLSMYAQ
jgi:hypothetical protein